MAVAVVDKQQQATLTGWRAALIYGFGIALAHRVLLTLWMAIVWGIVGASLGSTRIDFHSVNAQLPALTSPLEQSVFGVWRRWDAVHYLDLAVNGYRLDNAGATVFSLLTPFTFHTADALLPGSIDLAAAVVETVAFSAALALLYRVVELLFSDEKLARWSVVALALMPVSFFFAAPMSESIHLAFVLAFVYCALKDRWALAGVMGMFATLARSQGVFLVGVGGLLLIERYGWPPRQALGTYGRQMLPRAVWLALIPLGMLIFLAYRASLNLPPLDAIYSSYSYAFFVNPIEAVLINLRWIAANPNLALFHPDMWALFLSIGLIVMMVFRPRHRRPALVFYVVVNLAFQITKINYDWGTNVVMYSQSVARYALLLFPLTVLIADGLKSTTKWGRIVGVLVLLTSVLALSAGYVLALTGP
ncbi:MAG: hypothetical protein J0M07_03480 [Anaerolineae bacterium]|nr:hypothetical protein [Anaerolineae bacterium]